MVINRKPTIIIVAIVALITIVYFGWRPLLVAMYTPSDEFIREAAPPPLDYTNEGAWIAYPGKTSPALLSPEGNDETSATFKAAVFYVHPTTYFAGNVWNWTPDTSTYAQQGIEHTIATQASVFSACCDVYAPYYRQAHISAFGAGTEASLLALDLAYEDVENAFNQFLVDIGPSAPFFIAGHSQGSAHLHRLISEQISEQPIRERLLAAYLIGYWLPADISARSFPDIQLCQSADATGCVVTWDSYDRGAESLPFISVPHWFSSGWGRLEEVPTACVNPLSWRTDSDLLPSQSNLGAIESQPAGGLFDIIINRNPGVTYQKLREPLPNATSAQCDETSGKLLADTQRDNEFERSGHGESGSYHAFDWNLFYLNIRENVSTRMHAYASATGILMQ